MLSQVERASRAVVDAGQAGGSHPLVPAVSGCPDCLTTHMIASPAPLGSCPNCGALDTVLSARQVADAISGRSTMVLA